MISNELIIKRRGQGVELVAPVSRLQLMSSSIASMMKLPVNLYFMDTDSITKKMNDSAAQTCGYLSAQDAIGKSVRAVSRRDTASAILSNDREVVATKNLSITMESYTRLDDQDLIAISFKFPWFSNDDLIGIFGCSILLGYEHSPSLVHALGLLMQTGLLASPTTESELTSRLRAWEFEGIYFDQRDTDIMYLLVRGQTAKNIARALGLSHRTIEHRLEMIKQKLSVSSKSALIERIIDQFIVVPEVKGS